MQPKNGADPQAARERGGRAGAECVALFSDGEEAAETRSTSVVAQQFCATARPSLLVAAYALERGPAAATLFGQLARRTDTEPSLSIRFFLKNRRPLRRRAAAGGTGL